VATGELLHVLQGPPALTSLAFSPDGHRLAAVGYEGTVHLWDPATGLDVLTLRRPGPQMPEQLYNETQLVFSPDGRRLAINSWMGSLYVWEAPGLSP
jgi:WD40 repeat protein